MTPRSNADRVKTDRRDCLKLARLARAGELTPIHVPDEADEAMRDLVRAREDAVVMQRQARPRLGALLLRNDVRYNGKTLWSLAHRRFIAELRLPHVAQHIAFEEYAQGVDEAGKRIERLEAAVGDELTRWRWRPVVAALEAFCGIRTIHAVRLVAELGDLSRFASSRRLKGFLGLVPSQNSTGNRRRQGAITKTENSSARRALVEAAWAYRCGARVSVGIAKRQSGLPKPITDLGWKAQLRLRARCRRLSARGLNRNKIIVAVARELSGSVRRVPSRVRFAPTSPCWQNTTRPIDRCEPYQCVDLRRATMTVALARRWRPVRSNKGLGIAYFATVARAAQARAINEIEPSAAVGRRSRMRSRRPALAVSSSDMA